MAAAEEASKSLKCKTWILKVFIHCEGCRRQVKKALHSIDGVYTTTVDPQQHKVTVIGNLDSADSLIKKLSKAGKNAEIWSDSSPKPNKTSLSLCDEQNDTTKKAAADTTNNAGGEQQSGGKKTGKKNDTQAAATAAKPPPLSQQPPDRKELDTTSSVIDNTKKKKGGNNDTPAGAGGGAKKKKNQGGQNQKADPPKKNNENGGSLGSGLDLNLQHLLQQQQEQHTFSNYPFYSPNQATAPLYVLNYSNAPNPYGKDHTVSYHQLPASSISIGSTLETNAVPSCEGAVPRFDIFSEENPNGCSIM